MQLQSEHNAGLTNVGEYSTERKDGVEIVIEIDNTDIESVREKALKYLYFLDESYRITNIEQDEQYENEKLLETDFGFITKKPLTSHNAVIYMARVPYRVDPYGGSFSENVRNVLSCPNVCITFENNTLKYGTSREDLVYTKETVQNIEERVQQFIDMVSEQYTEQLASAKNLWDAICMYNTLSSSISYNVFQVFMCYMEYKGVKLNTFNTSNLYYDCEKVKKYYYEREVLKCSSSRYDRTLPIRKNTCIVYNRHAPKNHILSKIRYILKTTDIDTVYVLICKDDTQFENVSKKYHFDLLGKEHVINLDNAERWLQPKKKLGRQGVSTGSYKHINVFEFIPGSHYRLRECLQPSEHPKGFGQRLYLPIYAMKLDDKKISTYDMCILYYYFRETYRHVEQVQKESKIPIVYGIRRKDCEELPDYWVHFYTYVNKYIVKLLQKEKVLEILSQNVLYQDKQKGLDKNIVQLETRLEYENDTLFKTYVTQLDIKHPIRVLYHMNQFDMKFVRDYDYLYKFFITYDRLFRTDYTKQGFVYNINTLRTRIKELYPLFVYTTDNKYKYISNQVYQDMIRYITLVDTHKDEYTL